MKKQLLLFALFLAPFFAGNSWSQVSIQFNIGSQPLWGPTGYDYAQYYYMPDIDAYYDVANQDYVYFDDGRWVTSAYLPQQYANFDLYSAHKVVINSPNPWLRNDYYRGHYATYRGRHDQHPIRDSRETKYWANPEHPQHGHWQQNNTYGRGYEQHREWNGYRRGDWHDNGNREHGNHGNGEGHGNGHGEGHGGHGNDHR